MTVVKEFGKGGRALSSYQQRDWMRSIGKKRKYLKQSHGEGHWNARLLEYDVMDIQSLPAEYREATCKLHGISERHWYLIRARKRWKHI